VSGATAITYNRPVVVLMIYPNGHLDVITQLPPAMALDLLSTLPDRLDEYRRRAVVERYPTTNVDHPHST
jgi:hypothetical protein